MPYRIDLPAPRTEDFDRIIELGALDADRTTDGALAAVMPDAVAPEAVARALGRDITVSPAVARDDGSVWMLWPRPYRVGRLRIIPAAAAETAADTLRLIDAGAFGTGLHPTTTMCLELLDEIVQPTGPVAMLDVGTGSGVLALAALRLGVPKAAGADIDREALRVAAVNARLNGLTARLDLRHGGPDAFADAWPLVVANVLAAPLLQMAPVLVRRLGHDARLVLSGIPASAADEVVRAYRRLGLHHLRTSSRAGWVALVLQPSW